MLCSGPGPSPAPQPPKSPRLIPRSGFHRRVLAASAPRLTAGIRGGSELPKGLLEGAWGTLGWEGSILRRQG